METQVYAMRAEHRGSSIYHKMDNIKKIIYESPFVERIILDHGEIELTASKTELNIYSKTYLPNGRIVTTNKVTKSLIPGYNPQLALNKAKNDIVQRVINLEMERREANLIKNIENYVDKHIGFGKVSGL